MQWEYPKIYQANLQSIKDNQATFNFEEIDEFIAEAKKGKVSFDITPHDPNKISGLQRRKAYALIHDIADYEGYPDDIKKIALKEQYRAITGFKEFSLSDCHKDIATAFIAFLVEYCFFYDIPFRFKDITNTFDTQRHVFLCLLHKRCTVCGSMENIEINHEDTVGLGRDRRNIDHREHRLEALCRNHHFEFHTIGAEQFANKYHFHGIKLKAEELISLKLMTKTQIKRKGEGLT